MTVGELISRLREFDEWSPVVFFGPTVTRAIPVEVASAEVAYLPMEGLVGRARCCVLNVGRRDDWNGGPTELVDRP